MARKGCPRCGRIYNRYRRKVPLILSSTDAGNEFCNAYELCEQCAHEMRIGFYEKANRYILWEEDREDVDAIWAVSMVSPLWYRDGMEVPDHHCYMVGWYENARDARRALARNAADVNESGSYPYAVVEMMSPGMYGEDPNHRLWFEWDDELGGYKQIAEPPGFEHVCGFHSAGRVFVDGKVRQ